MKGQISLVAFGLVAFLIAGCGGTSGNRLGGTSAGAVGSSDGSSNFTIPAGAFGDTDVSAAASSASTVDEINTFIGTARLTTAAAVAGGSVLALDREVTTAQALTATMNVSSSASSVVLKAQVLTTQKLICSYVRASGAVTVEDMADYVSSLSSNVLTYTIPLGRIFKKIVCGFFIPAAGQSTVDLSVTDSDGGTIDVSGGSGG